MNDKTLVDNYLNDLMIATLKRLDTLLTSCIFKAYPKANPHAIVYDGKRYYRLDTRTHATSPLLYISEEKKDFFSPYIFRANKLERDIGEIKENIGLLLFRNKVAKLPVSTENLLAGLTNEELLKELVQLGVDEELLEQTKTLIFETKAFEVI